jgi:hypothetical protein
MPYLALIGDLVDSKNVSRRGDSQKKLSAALKRINDRKPRPVESPYTITLGDEFQAVYRTADTLFLDIFSIMAEMHPVGIRFGVGLGELTTPINAKQALGMDGPAFHRARAVITELKKSGYLLGVQGEPAPQGRAYDPWGLFNHLFNFVSHKVGRWERNRLHILAGLLANQPVAEIEEELEVSKVAVYKNINAAALDELAGLCNHISRFLNAELKKS